MPIPKAVIIADTNIDGVERLEINVRSSVDIGSQHDRIAPSATVRLYRKARSAPLPEMFKYAANEEGRPTIISGSIIMQNSRRHITYSIIINEAYISAWQFVQPPGDDDFLELITLQVGSMSLGAGGKRKSFEAVGFSTLAFLSRHAI